MNNEHVGLSMWVIYWNPSDFPHRYVVRRWEVAAGSAVSDDEPVAVVETLGEARRSVPNGLVHLGRGRADERQIVEVWL
jgi:hypothetical protein